MKFKRVEESEQQVTFPTPTTGEPDLTPPSREQVSQQLITQMHHGKSRGGKDQLSQNNCNLYQATLDTRLLS